MSVQSIGIGAAAVIGLSSTHAFANEAAASACAGVAQYMYELNEILDPELNAKDSGERYLALDAKYGREVAMLRIVMGPRVEKLMTDEAMSPISILKEQMKCAVLRNCDGTDLALRAMGAADQLVATCRDDYRNQ